MSNAGRDGEIAYCVVTLHNDDYGRLRWAAKEGIESRIRERIPAGGSQTPDQLSMLDHSHAPPSEAVDAHSSQTASHCIRPRGAHPVDSRTSR